MTLVGLCMVVGAANALNMYLERDSDALMARTKNRPLPAGRLQPVVALWLAWGLSVVALPLLAFVNMPTALLAAWAFALYAGFYTPFKRVTHHALLIGAVPGALPPLIGWTAVTGEIGLGGLLLFGVLFFWQVPHFLAIATLFADDYANAGLKVMPKTEPPRVVRVHALVHGVLLLVVSLGLVGSLGPRGGLGLGYGLSALLLGGAFLAVIAGDPGEEAEVTRRRRWARRVFFFSLIYLTALFAVIGVTGMLVTT
ncbi:MAG: heme o synthase [Polyangiaceae bacterium]